MTSSLLFRSKHKYYKPQNIYICINLALNAPNLIAKYMSNILKIKFVMKIILQTYSIVYS